MTDNFIHRIARRSNLNQVFLFGIGFAVGLVLLVISLNAYYNLFTGPYPISQEAVVNIGNLNDLKEYYVTVSGEEALDTGYEKVRRYAGFIELGRVKYTALVVGDRLLLVETGGDPNAREHSGALVSMPGDVNREVIANIEREVPNLKGAFLPFMLDTNDFQINTLLGLIAVLVVLGVCGWGILRAIGRMGDLSRHPILRRLQGFGDPEYVASQIEAEMNVDHEKIGTLHLTRNWAINMKSATFEATRFQDVMWLYKHVTQHRTYGIPTGKTFAAHVWDRFGNQMILNGKENAIDESLKGIFKHAPWVIAGHKPDIEAAYRKDRERFAQEVDKRRQQITSSQG